MSAAAPPPPPHLIPVSSSSNRLRDRRASPPADMSDAGGSTASLGGYSNGTPKPPTRPLPHIRDLIARAEKKIEENRYASIDKLLSIAEMAVRQSQFNLDVGRLDQAYMEYVTGYQIVTETVPRAKDAPKIQASQRLDHLNKELIRKITKEESRFAKVRDMIKADNDRTAIRPTADLSAQLQHHQAVDGRPVSVQQYSVVRRSIPNSTTSQRFSVPPGDTGNTQLASRPESHSQPLQAGINGSVGGLSEDRLSERFAKLRMNGRSPEEKASSNVINGYSNGYLQRRDAPLLHMPGASTAATSSSTIPTLPRSSIRVNTSTSKELPKPPSPTYTPTRTTQANTGYQPIRSTRSSITSVPERPPSASSTASIASQTLMRNNAAKHLSQHSEASERSSRPARDRRKSIHRPRETEINAKKLFDYLQTFHVLLIDVRNRTEYDAGHIFTSTGICIEPTALRPDMSAEELQEALVLSPEEEQLFFDRRDQFDLVVYYDQSSSADEPALHNPAMQHLNEALYDYNQEKPLKYPPVLLNGGLDAWIDLMGNQSLQLSTTAQRTRSSRPLTRRPPPIKAASRLEVQRRRHREYNPLDPEEERKWRERARSESIILDSQPSAEGEHGREQAAAALEGVDGFDQRYPDVSAIERRSDSRTQQRVPEPQRPPIPNYPVPPVPTPRESQSAPAIPARPPPAVPRPSYSGVSERLPSQSNATTKPSQLMPYIPPRMKKIPRVGLFNFGATCYMNATIQCLSATIDLTSYLFDQPYEKSLQKENWKGSKGILTQLYCTLLRNMWESRDVDTIRPSNFRKFCARLNKEWATDRQQDTKEFFDFLIDILHEDLNVNWRRNPNPALTPAEEAVRERLPHFFVAKEEWHRYTLRDHSMLTDLFAGQHMSRLQCTTCQHSSTTYETFYSISVEIPTPNTNRPVSVYDCLRSYCSAETLSGDEVWRCPRCRCEREAVKRITITRAPSILVLHFKRFSAGHSERARKIHTPVDFPLTGLDLEPFMLPRPSAQDVSYLAQRQGRAALETPVAMTPPYRYNAYAVTRHLGHTMASGHYIGLVQDRARGCWREFNDDRCTDFAPEQLALGKRLQNEQAYIVFYQRQAVGG